MGIMKKLTSLVIGAVLVLGLTVLTGCGEKKGPAENTGAKIDKAAGDVGNKANDVEKKADKAAKDAKKKADKEDSE